MKVTQTAIILVAATAMFGCGPSGRNTEPVKVDTAQKQVTGPSAGNPDTAIQSQGEKEFLETLYSKMKQKPVTQDGKPYRLLKKEQIKLYGSTETYTLAYVDIINGSSDKWPYKELYILDPKGEIIGNYLTEKYEPLAVFDNASPFLMVYAVDIKGYGVHLLIGKESDPKAGRTKNYLDNRNWFVLTIDSHHYDPKVLPYEVKDVNNDGQKDIVFSGKKDNKPFSLKFIWDKKLEMFEPDTAN